MCYIYQWFTPDQTLFGNSTSVPAGTIFNVLDAQLDERRPAAAFVLRGLGHQRYVRVLLQHLAESFAEDAHTAAMDYADAGQPGQEGAVHELFNLAARDVDGLADDIDFHRHVRALALQLHRDAAGSRRVHWRLDCAHTRQNFGDVIAGDLHFHGAHLDFEMRLADLAGDSGSASGGFELDGVALEHVLDDLRLGMRIALIRASRVRYDRRVELFAKFAAQLGNAALGVFRKLLCSRAILDGVDCFAGVILEVAQHALEFLLHLAHFGLLVFASISL